MKENEKETVDMDIVADIKGEILTPALFASNPIYSPEGAQYIPYYARKNFEVSNHTDPITECDINMEYASLGFYKNRRICSAEHFAKLVNLNTTGLDTDAIVKRDRIVQFYFTNIVNEKVYGCLKAMQRRETKWAAICKTQMKVILSQSNVVRNAIRYMGGIDAVIAAVRIITPIDTNTVKSRETVIAMLRLLAPEERDFATPTYGHMVPYMLTYIIRSGLLTDEEIPYDAYGEEITLLLSALGSDVFHVNLEKLPIEAVKAHAKAIFCKCDDIFTMKKMFTSMVDVNYFIDLAIEQGLDKKKIPDIMNHKILPPWVTKFEKDTYILDTIRKNPVYKHITKPLALMISTSFDDLMDVDVTCDNSMFDSLAVFLVSNAKYYNSPEIHLRVREYFHKIKDVNEFFKRNMKRVYKDSGEAIFSSVHFIALKEICLSMNPGDAFEYIYDIMSCTSVKIRKNLVKVLTNMQSVLLFGPTFSDEQLTRLEKYVPIVDIVKCATLRDNMKYIQKQFGKGFISIPIECMKGASNDDLMWMWKNCSKEERMAYPFNLYFMKKNEKLVAPYLSRINTDRYCKAFGINWVLDHGDVNLTDIIRADIKIDRKTIETFLDMILLDTELRGLFLSRKHEVYIEDKELFFEVMRSVNFSNAIKCDYITAVLPYARWAKDMMGPVIYKDYIKYAAAAGDAGYKMLFTLCEKGLIKMEDTKDILPLIHGVTQEAFK